jgi:hypothetical protein
VTLGEIIEQLESCGYECEAGRLEDNLAWRELKEMAESEEDEYLSFKTKWEARREAKKFDQLLELIRRT